MRDTQHLGYMAIGLAGGVTGPILYLLRGEFGLSYTRTGQLLSIQSLGIIAAMASAGYLMDRWGRKAVLLAGGGVLCGGLCGNAFSWDYASLIVFSLLWCVGYGLFSVGFSSICSDTNGNQGNAMNFLHVYYGIGAILAPVMATLCIHFFGNWRPAYIVPCALSLAVCILLTWLQVEDKRSARTQKRPAPIKSLFLWVSGIYAFIYVGIEVTMQGWLPTFWVETAPRGLVPATLITTFFWVSITAGRFMAGRIADRIGLQRYLSIVSTTTAGIALLWVWVRWEPAAYLIIFVIGLLIGGIYPTVMVSTNVRFPGLTGVITSFISTVSGFAGFVLQPAVGGIADTYGIVLLPLIVGALAVLLSALAAWRNRMMKKESACLADAGTVQYGHE
jgi:fucose permease